jgi:hypothetical protein
MFFLAKSSAARCAVFICTLKSNSPYIYLYGFMIPFYTQSVKELRLSEDGTTYGIIEIFDLLH